MVIAVPRYGDIVAPCFETSTEFHIAVVEEAKIILSRHITYGGCKGFGRVSLLRENNVNTLICGGIEVFYLNLLASSNIEVISPVSMKAEKAIESYLAGDLRPAVSPEYDPSLPIIPLDDLICWSKDIFSVSGFRIFSDSETIPFPIDFLAEIDCPLCRGSTMAAVCCGAHAYKAEYELREFDRVSRQSGYHARVYVHALSDPIRRLCGDLGIELIDPFDDRFDRERELPGPRLIPLLKTPIVGHEKAFRTFAK